MNAPRVISGASIMLVLSLLLAAVLAITLWRQQRVDYANGLRTLRVACAAGIKPPTLAAADAYTREHGTVIEITYGGSATLLAGLAIKPDAADLYIAADDSYIIDGRTRGLLAESIPLARMQLVLAVARGNPRGISSIDDLFTQSNLRIGVANPEAAAAGKLARNLLQASGHWDDLRPRIAVFKPTVVEIANDLALGAIDVGLIWDATAKQYDEISAIAIPEFDSGERSIEVAVVASTTQPTEALRFARYLAARDRGQQHFGRRGYAPVDADRWSERPRLVLFAGSMFNEPIEATIESFAEREGVEIERVYNGCGILVGQMHAGARPDGYLSCDTVFMEDVQDQFRPSRIYSENPMVLLTQQGNPSAITSLEDLLKPGLRIGLAHPEKSALGALTQQLLTERQLLEPLQTSGNLVYDAPQGDFLTNAMQTGSLDASIVYASNAAAAGDALEQIAIPGLNTFAEQPWAIARTSDNARTMQRLFDALTRKESAQRFRAWGFRWIADEDETP